MISRDDLPPTPDWVLPKPPAPPPTEDHIVLGEN